MWDEIPWLLVLQRYKLGDIKRAEGGTRRVKKGHRKQNIQAWVYLLVTLVGFGLLQ